MPGIQDCPRNNLGTAPCKGRRRFGAELWLCCSDSRISLKCCSHLVLGDFTASSAVGMLDPCSCIPELSLFSSSWPLLCCFFWQEWQEGLPWFWQLHNWGLLWSPQGFRGLEFCFGWRVPSCLNLGCFNFYFLARLGFFFFLCASRFCGLCAIVYLMCVTWLKSLSADNTWNRECLMFSRSFLKVSPWCLEPFSCCILHCYISVQLQ